MNLGKAMRALLYSRQHKVIKKLLQSDVQCFSTEQFIQAYRMYVDEWSQFDINRYLTDELIIKQLRDHHCIKEARIDVWIKNENHCLWS